MGNSNCITLNQYTYSISRTQDDGAIITNLNTNDSVTINSTQYNLIWQTMNGSNTDTMACIAAGSSGKLYYLEQPIINKSGDFVSDILNPMNESLKKLGEAAGWGIFMGAMAAGGLVLIGIPTSIAIVGGLAFAVIGGALQYASGAEILQDSNAKLSEIIQNIVAYNPSLAIYMQNENGQATQTYLVKTGTDHNDNIIGSNSNDIIYGNGGNDNIIGGSGADIIFGDYPDRCSIYDGDDTIDGGVGNDFLMGGAGNDTYKFSSGFGTDTVDDSEGNNKLDFSEFTSGISVDLTKSYQQVGTSWLKLEEGTVINNLVGGSGSDSLTGTDPLLGIGGNDTIYGNAGNDLIDGGKGADKMYGGKNNDTYIIDDAGDEVTEIEDEGIDNVKSSVSYNLGANLENLYLTGDGNITGAGNSQNNYIYGNNSNNILNGLGGNDVLDGRKGNDTLKGGDGIDKYIINGKNSSDITTIEDSDGQGQVFYNNYKLATAYKEEGSNNVYKDSRGNVYTLSDSTLTVSNASINGQIQINGFYDGKLGINLKPEESSSIEVSVDGRSGPWDISVNPSYFYGGSDNYNLSPTIVSASDLTMEAGDKLTIQYLGGQANGGGDGIWNDAEGAVGWSGNGYGGPGYYVSDTVWLETLLGTFANSSGVIIGSPFKVGNYTDIVVPEGAAELLLGFNDGWYNDNGGSLTVQITNKSYNEFFGTDSDDTIVTGDNDSNIQDEGGINSIITGLGNDILKLLNNVRSYINAGNGNNLISLIGNAFNCYNTVITGTGNDTITVEDSYNTINTNESDDVITIGLGNDNTVDAGSGNDTITGDTAANTLIGGTGNDTYNLNNSIDVITENVEEGIDTINSSVTYTLGVNIENLTLAGTLAINGTGNELNNIITGNSANNIIEGSTGNDTLVGSLGSDTYIFNIGDGNDVIDDAKNSAELINSDSDNIVFKEGISKDNILFSVDGNNLVISFKDSNDELTLINQLSYSNIEKLDFADGTSLSNSEFIKMISVRGSENNDTLVGTSYAENIYGYGGDDAIDGCLGNDTLIGGIGNDYLLGGYGDDVLSSGVGNELIQGCQGNDTYMYNVGDGNDTINDASEWDYNGVDTVKFGEGIKAEDLSFKMTPESHMVISFANNPSDSLTILNQYEVADNVFQIENFQFADGTVLTSNDIYSLIRSKGTDNDDSLIGTERDEKMYGYAGNDTLDGGSGNDTMLGSTGNDIYIVDNIDDVITEYANEGTDTVNSAVTYTLGTNLENLTLIGTSAINGTGNTLANVLTGNTANNVLNGSTGVDTMIGGRGNDTYIFNTGDGQDLIQDSDGVDIISFGSGITKANLTFVKDNNNLAISLNSSSDKITVENWFTANTNKIETLVFADGTSFVSTDIDKLFSSDIIGTTGDDTLTGDANANTIKGLAGNDTINGAAGADSMIGGAGNDTYYVDNTGDFITENSSEGTDVVNSSITCTIGSNVENLILTGTSALTGTGNTLDNYITGNSANNTLSGLAGNDTIDGGLGNDTMKGGAGNDTYYINVTTDVITENASEGTDTVNSSVTYTLGSNLENLALTGTSAINGTGNTLNNYITGNSAVNTLTDSTGNDTLDGGAGADKLLGGAGNDVYYVDNTGDIVTENASAGTDTVNSSITYTLGTNLENLTLIGSSAINGTGNTLANILTGNSGNNVLNGSTGIDTMIGGAGNDTYYLDVITDVITENTNEGTDTVNIGLTYTLGNNVENLTLTGTTAINGTGNALDNVLTGNAAINTLTGGAGNDTLNGAAGADKMLGGAGNDTYYVDISTDVITENATEGTDTVNSAITYTLGTNLENLTLAGTSAINGTGNTLANVLTGNTANNILNGSTGADTMIGGTGNDTYYVDNTGDVITENASAGTDIVSSSITYTLGSNLENLTLSGSTAINGTGNEFNNVLTGNSGINILTGAAGNDTINGGTGADKMLGGAGNDTYYVDNASDIITENVSEGTDIVSSSITYTLGSNIENLTLTGSSALTGTGNTLNNYITGNTGNNTLLGLAGNDTIDGGLGNDTMKGGAGDDTYFVNIATDIVTENASEGTDTVNSAVTYTLGSNLENLTLTGTSAINGTGNTLNNILTGNAAINTLTGGAGNDTYMFSLGSKSDTVVDTAGTDKVHFNSDVVKTNIAMFIDSSKNLIIDYGTTKSTDIVKIQNQASYTVERVELNSGQYLTNADINTLIQNMTAYAKSHNISMTSVAAVRNNQNLMSLVSAAWHS